MAAGSQKRTTMAKLNREAALRERRQRKQAKKDARKQASAYQPGQSDEVLASDDQSTPSGTGQPALDPIAQSLVDV